MNYTKGFTLIEVVVAVGIVALIMIAIVDLSIRNDSLIKSQSATIDVVRSASAFVSDLQTNALQANSIVVSHTFSGDLYTTDSDTLVLELPSITSSGDVVLGAYDYIAYYASSTGAYRAVDAGAGSARDSVLRRLSNTVTELIFTYDNVDPTLSTSVEVDVQTNEQVKATTTATHVHTTIYLRNKI